MLAEADQRESLVNRLPLLDGEPREEGSEDALLALGRELQVLEDGVTREDRRTLELAADPQLDDFVLCESRDVLSFEAYGPRVGSRLSGDDVHERRLSGAVRTHDASELAGLEVERQVVERSEAVEAHGDVVDR